MNAGGALASGRAIGARGPEEKTFFTSWDAEGAGGGGGRGAIFSFFIGLFSTSESNFDDVDDFLDEGMEDGPSIAPLSAAAAADRLVIVVVDALRGCTSKESSVFSSSSESMKSLPAEATMSWTVAALLVSSRLFFAGGVTTEEAEALPVAAAVFDAAPTPPALSPRGVNFTFIFSGLVDGAALTTFFDFFSE